MPIPNSELDVNPNMQQNPDIKSVFHKQLVGYAKDLLIGGLS
jgi:hypothetical protein